MCCVFLMVNPFQGMGDVVSGQLPPVRSQMSAASESSLENKIFFLSLGDMRIDSFLKKFKGRLLTSSSAGEREKRLLQSEGHTH